MSAGQIVLVSYGEENMFLNDEPQISYFKQIYRRYTNFSIETIQTNFLYKPDFGQRYSCEISKYGDLITKMWLVIELPNIPIILNIDGTADKRLKFAWALKVAYVLIDYVEITIGGNVISKHYGEYLANLETLNPTLFNSKMNEYNGNLPELTEFKPTDKVRQSYILRIPLQFWFCINSTQALPTLCLEYSTITLNVSFREFKACSIITPTNYLSVRSYYGVPIFNEPIVQYNPDGIAWGAFDSIETDKTTSNFKTLNYNMYFRKISNIPFQTFDLDYLENLNIVNVLDNFLNKSKYSNYVIYCLWSKSILIPTSNFDSLSNQIENKYFYRPFENKLSIISTYLLVDYAFIDKAERNIFYNNKHEYLIEQVYFSGDKLTNNNVSSNKVDMINPCKWVMFMGQLDYMTNYNVNDYFNYTTLFYKNNQKYAGIPVINKINILLNDQTITGEISMDFYNKFQPFLKFPKSYDTSNGFGIYSFSLYPITIQASGTINLSAFSNISINTSFNVIDSNNTNYRIKAYFITLNVFKVIHGVGDMVFNNYY